VAKAAHDVRFDLVVATVDRTDDLAALLDDLEAQTHRSFRLVVVDQNADERVERVLEAHPGLDVLRLRSERGLSRARNAALGELTADVVGFPDDDCRYHPGLLERVAARFAEDRALGGVSGRPVAADGRTAGRWPERPDAITRDTVWHTANSHTIFLRRGVVERVGGFDEALGLGSGTPWSSGEEIDYLVRAVRSGARIAYDPAVTVTHPAKTLTDDERRAVAYRDGASVGYILRKNRYPARVVARMLIRPLGGALVSLIRLDWDRALAHLTTLRGRATGYRRPADA
jgi:GT2 family glycosyltransferase